MTTGPSDEIGFVVGEGVDGTVWRKGYGSITDKIINE